MQVKEHNPVTLLENYDKSVQKRYNRRTYWLDETDRTVNILVQKTIFEKNKTEVIAKHAIKINMDTGEIIQSTYSAAGKHPPKCLTSREIQAIFAHFLPSSTQ